MKRIFIRFILFFLQNVVRLIYTVVAFIYAIADTVNLVFIILFLYILYQIFIEKNPLLTTDVRFTIFILVFTGSLCLLPAAIEKVCDRISEIDYWISMKREVLKEKKC